MAPVAAHNNINRGNAKDKLHQVQQSHSDISFMLYLHREELRKRKPNFMRKACIKLQLTNELITKNARNADKCSTDDLHSISRQTIFKNKLRRQIARFKYYHAEKDQKQLRQQLKQHLPQKKQQELKQHLPQEQQQTQQNRNEEKEMPAELNKIRRKLF